MSVEFTEHELALMERMTPQHRALMEKIGPAERKSLEKNVSLQNIDLIQSWIGTDEQLEKVLFWYEGGKYDDPRWQALKPLNDSTAELWEKAKAKCRELRALAVEYQRRSDLTLYSQFNPGLLFSGVAPAVRCDESGAPNEAGECFQGVELRLIGSIDDAVDSITIFPCNGGYEVQFGPRVNDAGGGIAVYGGDNYSLMQAAMLIDKRISAAGFAYSVEDEKGNPVQLDARELRKSGKNSVDLGWGARLTLKASKYEPNADHALNTAVNLMTWLYDRLGLEREALNLNRVYGNFGILRDENFAQYLGDGPAAKPGLVFLTATLVCRRCRREIKAFRNLTRNFPNVQFLLVNLNSPLFKFYDRVFGDMGGGDADEFRKNAAGVTPFTIVYAANGAGKLEYKEYYGTGKSEACPEYEKQVEILERHIR